MLMSGQWRAECYSSKGLEAGRPEGLRDLLPGLPWLGPEDLRPLQEGGVQREVERAAGWW